MIPFEAQLPSWLPLVIPALTALFVAPIGLIVFDRYARYEKTLIDRISALVGVRRGLDDLSGLKNTHKNRVLLDDAISDAFDELRGLKDEYAQEQAIEQKYIKRTVWATIIAWAAALTARATARVLNWFLYVSSQTGQILDDASLATTGIAAIVALHAIANCLGIEARKALRKGRWPFNGFMFLLFFVGIIAITAVTTLFSWLPLFYQPAQIYYQSR